MTGCSTKELKPAGQYPVIDVGSIAGKYQRVYCSDFFSSIELIPLETNDNSIVYPRVLHDVILANDSLIFILSDTEFGRIIHAPVRRVLLVFDRYGKYLNHIGSIGQGPGEFLGIHDFYFNPEKPTIFVNDFTSIYEYEFNGKFIGSFRRPMIEGKFLYSSKCIENNIFFGSSFSREQPIDCFLFDRKSEIIKIFQSHFFNETDINSKGHIKTFQTDGRLYVKDDGINDTLYVIENFNLHPICVFDFGKYAYPLGEKNEAGQRKIINFDAGERTSRFFENTSLIVMPNYYYYELLSPKSLPAPKSRPEEGFAGKRSLDRLIHGIYDITKNTNVLFDTDHFQQKGFINDINGGLSIIPRYYAGNGEVIDIWRADDMKEMLTEEYFSTQTIKDKEAHQKLRELLKNLKEDDNPVVVIAKLK